MGMKYAGYNIDARCAAKNRVRKEKYNIINTKKNIVEDHIRSIKEKDIEGKKRQTPQILQRRHKSVP